MSQQSQTQWKSRPIFISSTFKDMGEEREYLNNYIFPQLEERLRERRHFLEPIDLRWGVETVSIEEEHEKELLVLKVCLGEIERSRPFLIALIGDRYGWVPPEDRMQQATQEAGYPYPIKGKSITALEIEYGVLSSIDKSRRSYFYMREPLPYDKMPPDIAAMYSDSYSGNKGTAKKLEALKEAIRQNPNLRDRVRSYSVGWDEKNQKVSALASFGEMVLEDLWHDLKEETEKFLLETHTWQDEERALLNEFIERTTRSFAGREIILKKLNAFALSNELSDNKNSICISGSSGTGKSALFAEICQELAKEDIYLLANATGISLNSSKVDSMLERWIDELSTYLNISNPLPDEYTFDEIDTIFLKLLTQANDAKRVVILVDALNLFEAYNRGFYMTWLPDEWPDNVRLICTSSSCQQLESFLAHEYSTELAIPALQKEEAIDIAVAICNKYHRQLNRDVIAKLIEKDILYEDKATAAYHEKLSKENPEKYKEIYEATLKYRKNIQALLDGNMSKSDDFNKYAYQNPQWLIIAVESLNMLDTDSLAFAELHYSGNPEERILQLMLDTVDNMPGTTSELYSFLFKKAEKLFGHSMTSTVFILFMASSRGWREKDLKILVPEISGKKWDKLSFTNLQRFFRSILREEPSIPGAIRFSNMIALQHAVSKHYSSEIGSMAKLHSTTANYLMSLPVGDVLRLDIMYHIINSNSDRYSEYYAGDIESEELIYSTRTIVAYLKGYDNSPLLETELLRILNWVDSCKENRDTLIERFQVDVYDELSLRFPLEFRKTYHSYLLRISERFGSEKASYISLAALSEICIKQGSLEDAIIYSRKGIDLSKGMIEANPSNEEFQNIHTISNQKLAEIFCEKQQWDDALHHYNISLGIVKDLRAQYSNNDTWVNKHPEILIEIGCTQIKAGHLVDASKTFQEAYSILSEHRDKNAEEIEWNMHMANTLDGIFQIQNRRGNVEQAQKKLKESIQYIDNLIAIEPYNPEWKRARAVFNIKMARIFKSEGLLDEALAYYELSIEYFKEQFFQNTSHTLNRLDLVMSYSQKADLLVKSEQMFDALETYKKAFNLNKILVEFDPDNRLWSHSHYLFNFQILNALDTLGIEDEKPPYLRSCYNILLSMKDKGMPFDPQMEYFFAELEIRIANLDSGLFSGEKAGSIETEPKDEIPLEDDAFFMQIQQLADKEEYKTALKLLKKHENEVRKLLDPRKYVIKILESRALIYQKMDKYKDTLNCYQQLENIFIRMEQNEDYTDILLSQAELYVSYIKKPEKAIPFLKEAISLSEEYNYEDLLIEAKKMLEEAEQC